MGVGGVVGGRRPPPGLPAILAIRKDGCCGRVGAHGPAGGKSKGSAVLGEGEGSGRSAGFK